MSDSPPSSWYDPPEPRYDFEVNQSKPADAGTPCERYECDEEAAESVEIRDLKVPYGGGWWVDVCKGHADSVIDDEIELALQGEDDEPDFDED